MDDVLLDDDDRRRRLDWTGALMRAPTPPSAETDAALEAAIEFLRACGAINWLNFSADVSFFRPKHRRTKLDAMYKKNFAKLFAMARAGDTEVDYYLRQKLLEEASLPPDKREALGWLLLKPATKLRRGRGRRKVANLDRDFIIAQAVLRATASGLDATRSTATASGSSVVAEALRQLGLPRMSERTINRIWLAHTKRERDEDMKVVLVP
jgi:hypothetical protein